VTARDFVHHMVVRDRMLLALLLTALIAGWVIVLVGTAVLIRMVP
jgi:hypothetical protein